VPAPYHVRLAISRHGEQFRVELFTENLGDTSGHFFPAADWDQTDPNTDTFRDVPFTGWLTWLAENAPLLGTQGEDLGKKLFRHLLGAEALLRKWGEVVKHAEQQGRGLRLLIDAAEDVPALPYGLLYDAVDGHYLLRAGSVRVQLVRVLRQCTPRRLNLIREPLRVLLAAAEPTSAGIPPVGCAACLRRLAEALARWPKYQASLCLANGERMSVGEALAGPAARWAALCAATPEGLQRALREGEFDVLHLMAHGYGDGLVLCAAGSGRANVPAHELAEWCGRGPGKRLEMVFLQVCYASATRGRGAFGGVAQALLNPRVGDVAAVIASPYPVEPAGSTEAAVAFYEGLAAPARDGEEPALNPDALLPRRLPMGNWAWAFLEMWARPGALGKPGDPGVFTFPRPYRGLNRFEEQDHDIFHGRGAELKELLDLLNDNPAVAVFGDSGSGKSSLLQAGLASEARRHGLAGRPGWRIVSLRPGDRPARSLATALMRDEGRDLPEPEDWCRTLATLLDYTLREEPLLVLFDQFEEAFTLVPDARQRLAAGRALAEATERHPDRFRLVVGVRSDYLGHTLSLPGLDRLLQKLWLLRPPGPEKIRAIIEEPARTHGYVFEGAKGGGPPTHAQPLLERILADPLLAAAPGEAEGQAGAAPLPLLEFALEQLWRRAVDRGSQEFTHDDFDGLGGLAGVIARHAEAVYLSLPVRAELGPDAQKVAERLLVGVVSGGNTRRPRPRDVLETEAGGAEANGRVVDHLVRARLLQVRSDPNNLTVSLVELAHEVLITRWERLAGWLAQDPEGRALKEAFQQDVDKWERVRPGTPPRSRKNLPSPNVATAYLAWIDKARPDLSPVQQAFVKEMKGMLARRRRWLRGSVIAALVLAGIMTGLWLYARTEKNLYRESLKSLYGRSIALARETLKEGDLKKTRAILGSLQPARGQEDLRDSEWYALMKECDSSLFTFLGHTGKVNSVAVAPSDGTMVASASEDNTIKLWSWDGTTGGEIATLQGGAGDFTCVAFSTDGKQLASGGKEAVAVRLWDVSTKLYRELKGHTGGVNAVAFSPDGKLLASGSDDQTVRLWDLNTYQPRILRGHPPPVLSVAFSPDSRTLVAGGKDPIVNVWDLPAANPPRVLPHNQAPVLSLAFCPPAGTGVAGAGWGPAVKIWSVQTGEPTDRLKDPDGDKDYTAVAYSADGKCLAAANKDGSIRLWDVVSDKLYRKLKGHTAPVTSVAFSADGKLLVSGSEDDTVKVWSLPPPESP
jgi:WD40 repeat protein